MEAQAYLEKYNKEKETNIVVTYTQGQTFGHARARSFTGALIVF